MSVLESTQQAREGGLPAPGVPVSDLDPYSADVLIDPYPYYEMLRELGPVVWLEKYGVYAVARYDQVKQVLSEADKFGSSAGIGLTNFHTEEPWRKPSIILEVDVPDHTRTRKVFTRILSPKALNALRERFEREAEKLVTALIEKGECDAVADFAHAFPIKVFADAVGVPAEGREHLLPYGDMVFNAFGPVNDRFRECLTKLGPSSEWIAHACRRDVLTKDGFGAQLYAAADAGEITEEEAGMLVRTMLSAGLDTTIFTLSNAMASLGRHPDQWAILRDEPSRSRAVLEEVLRYDPTFQSFYRTTTRAVELAGVPIGAEQKILVFIAAGNRDPRHWANPDTFDVRRQATGNVAFGTGIHGCAGQMIARLEGEILLRVLATRVDSLELLGEPEVHFNNTVRGYSRMPMRITPRVAAS
ncbi:cytochrome P450 [Sphingobium sp. SCG-1]|uniref:cytochrome P450 n=1 Tax=Sphingobium sp. SCG-1 TaxID=2072936 RepID=UPI000CD6B794|nr:cytochrome P450 [Sphingobium sp. SCG-1]AUW59655.1 cytochrome P450 [Sphingobium sp. SCG-1]